MKMAITAGKALAITLATLLTGCGLTQKVTDGTVAVTKSIFYRQVKTLHLDIQAREGVNNNAKGHRWQRWCEFTSLKSVRRLTVLIIRRCSPVTLRPLKPILWRKRISACALANR